MIRKLLERYIKGATVSHQPMTVEGAIEVCDTCVNSLGYQVAWEQAVHSHESS